MKYKTAQEKRVNNKETIYISLCSNPDISSKGVLLNMKYKEKTNKNI